MKRDVVGIRIEDVSLRYARRGPLVLEQITLDVPPGKTVGLVGESGSGKSSLGRLIVGERPATSGRIEIGGQEWNRTTRRGELRRSVQMIFQDPFGALNPYMTPLEAVSETVHVARKLPKERSRERATELLEQVGLAGRTIERTPSSLSGGQRQRVVIARALACDPKVIIADEATSALDVSVQAQILNVLMGLQEELGLTMLFISHDIAVINHVTDEVAVLEGGVIVEHGATEAVIANPQHPYTRKLLAAFGDEPRDGPG
jgi:peptide/nickel transport system ATP-binding protein